MKFKKSSELFWPSRVERIGEEMKPESCFKGEWLKPGGVDGEAQGRDGYK